MGLFHKKSERPGLKTKSKSALIPILSADARSKNRARLDREFDSLMREITAVVKDINSLTGHATQRRSAEHGHMWHHYRCISRVMFWHQRYLWPNAVFYIEHPESKCLLPITECVKNVNNKDAVVVWVSDFDSYSVMVVPETTIVYVSDEPQLAGKTLEEVEAGHHGQDKYHPDGQSNRGTGTAANGDNRAVYDRSAGLCREHEDWCDTRR